MKMWQKVARLRDSKDGMFTCISCGATLPYESSQGGHYITRQCLCTCNDMDNINAQCGTCNVLMNGNLVGYRRGLIAKIGEERVNRLELMFLASRGSEEALKNLSQEDRCKVGEKRSKRYWDDDYNKAKAEYDRLETRLR